jgi:hypothetical protein
MNESGDEVLWASVDPTLPAALQPSESSARGFSMYARPIHVELSEGETLYLPSGKFFTSRMILLCLCVC